MTAGIFDTGLAKVQGGTIRNGFNLHSFNNWGEKKIVCTCVCMHLCVASTSSAHRNVNNNNDNYNKAFSVVSKMQLEGIERCESPC